MVEPLEHLELVAGIEQPRLVQGVSIQPSPRWVRAYFGGQAVADSKRVLLAYEPRRLPVYWFPTRDVRMDLLRPARQGGQTASGTARRPRLGDLALPLLNGDARLLPAVAGRPVPPGGARPCPWRDRGRGA